MTSSSGTTIAIIDDHELVREGLASLITGGDSPVGHLVYCGESPVEAAQYSPEVALLDVDLGPGAARLADSVTVLMEAGARVLLISAFEDAVAVRGAMTAGALGFVPKRASVDVLREALETVGAGEFYLSVDLAAILASAAESPELSPRELDVLRLYASGLKLTAVANQLGISPHTAKEYLDRVRAKYALVGRTARTRTELYVEANRDGLLELDR
jgi:two-component system, NarL family, nitrate/nitrite response regulator NarL